MGQEIIITLTNDCECSESGECTCKEGYCNGIDLFCECGCVECETEYIAIQQVQEQAAESLATGESDEVCACGGNCGCGE